MIDLLFVVLMAPLVAMASSDSEPVSFPSPPAGVVMPMRGVAAHRGASDTHPENTVPAFREALRLGVHQIEFDVYLSRDGVPVVMHDPTIDRTTNGSGSVTDFTLDQLRQLDAGGWKNQRFAGTRVPTLEEVLAMMPPNVWLNVHLRGGRESGRATAAKIVRHNRTHQAFIACGREAALGAREIDPSILICNMEGQGHDARYVDTTLQQRDQVIQLIGGMATPDLIERLHRHGLVINFCCTNDPADLEKIFAHGIDFPLTDRVGVMLDQAERLGVPRRSYVPGETYERQP